MCLSLTDADGVVLRQWVGNNDIMRGFEKIDVVPGFSVAETVVGNSSGSSLITRRPTIVRGPEHFAPQFADFTSAGTVITHPASRRVVGSLNLTCLYEETSPMALSWVCEIVTDIERKLLDAATTAEQLLLRRFLLENRDARHAVVAVNAQTAMTNAAAAKLMGSVDQAQLWAYASAILAEPDTPAPIVTMTDGARVRVHRSAVVGAGDSLGVVLRLARISNEQRHRSGPLVELPRLVGDGQRWTDMRRRLTNLGTAPLLLVGDAGVGKGSIARALAGADNVQVDGADGCAAAELVRASLPTLSGGLVVLHLDDVPAEDVEELVAILGAVPAGVRLVATSRRSPASGAIDPRLLEFFHEIVPVPNLGDRAEDVPAIVAELAERHKDTARTIHWMPDAIQALTRRRWPENVRSLDRLVKHVVASVHHDYIGLKDLPAHVTSGTGRRQLSGLERVEAEAMLQALRDASWNKQKAAEALGIARSTLYRKMQALGLDRDSTF
ncbi:helix-turn-helix domain-containing protein [Nocardioides sp. NPDC057767]|uniref:helix-turn-helix domain-containing protein n=1 Tax=unclassified Nocardioides TaxID=2615069 RepID=UPI0036707403